MKIAWLKAEGYPDIDADGIHVELTAGNRYIIFIGGVGAAFVIGHTIGYV
jgi:hypothetical protein